MIVREPRLWLKWLLAIGVTAAIVFTVTQLGARGSDSQLENVAANDIHGGILIRGPRVHPPTATPSPAATPDTATAHPTTGQDQTVRQGDATATPASASGSGLAAVLQTQERVALDVVQGSITFYNCVGPNGGYWGTMASGATVYEGSAACGYSYPLGTIVRIAGDYTARDYVCEDRGYLAWNQVDVFWYDEGPIDGSIPGTGWFWLKQVGTYGTIEIVE